MTLLRTSPAVLLIFPILLLGNQANAQTAASTENAAATNGTASQPSFVQRVLPGIPAIPRSAEQLQRELFQRVDDMNRTYRLLYDLQSGVALIKSKVFDIMALIDSVTVRPDVTAQPIEKELQNVAKEQNNVTNNREDNVYKLAGDFDDDFPNFMTIRDILTWQASGVLAPQNLPPDVRRVLLREASHPELDVEQPRVDQLVQKLAPFPNLPLPLQSKVGELTELVDDINKNWKNLVIDKLHDFNLDVSDNFFNWIPKDPAYNGNTIPTRRQRLGKPEDDKVSKAQMLNALRIYALYLDKQKQAVGSLDEISSQVDKFKQMARNKITTFLNTLEQMVQTETTNTENIREDIAKSVINITAEKANLALGLFIWLLIAFIFSLLGLHLIIMFLGKQAAGRIFASDSLLNIFTVFVLVTSIVILAMAGQLESRDLSTLIAAISGYVLGQLGRRRVSEAQSQGGSSIPE
jgi:hypothetical protein